jgi:CDP-2,3-bis-(O-geranylgeranyl)-sn-glycerol synthase
MHDLIVACLLFLPAAVANATPVLANKVPLINRWSTPMDFGHSWRGKRLLGANKSWRGFFTGSFLAGVTGVLVVLTVDSRYTLFQIFLLGCLLGAGALAGDAVESFIKRQKGIPSGKSWFPFDQIDYIIGGLIVIYPFLRLPLGSMLLIFVLFFGLHLLGALAGYLLGLKDTPI